MKRLLLLLTVCMITAVSAFAQRTVSGVIADPSGEPLFGANVVVKGTTVGAVTDFDGAYELVVPEGNNELVVSFTGYETQEITLGESNVIDFTMTKGIVLQEAVITALGISREKKQLGYAVTEVGNESITRTSEVSPLDGLKGKVAGLEISQASGQPGASRKVRLRGVGSISGNVSPLIVIDGVPQADNFTGTNPAASGALDRQEDFGNALSDLNPNDIKSMTVLKGAAASALYGNRAASGVILVTTKSGAYNSPKLKVEYTGSYTASEILRVPQTQDEFGNGWSGVRDLNENGSWGPRLDGINRVFGRVVNDQQRVKAYSAQHEDSYRAAFDIGKEFQNSVAFSAGNKTGRFRASFTNVNADGIIPTDNDRLSRNSVSLNGGLNINKWDISSSINFINKDQNIVPGGQGDNAGFGRSYINSLQQIPVDYWIPDIEDISNPFNNADNYYTSFAGNPYQVLNQNSTNAKQNRTYGNISLKYQLRENLAITSRLGGDVSTTNIKAEGAIVGFTPGSPNDVLGATGNPGAVRVQSISRRQWNYDLFANYNTALSDKLDLNVIAGWNAWESQVKSQAITARTLILPNYYNVNNTASPQTVATDFAKRRSHGVYGQFEFGFDRWIYLTLSGRNDYFSTLNLDNNSGFYPAASVSFDLTDKVFGNSSIVDFFKVRAGFAQVANDAPVYAASEPGFSSAIIRSGGFGNLNLPIGGITGFEVGDAQADPDLVLEVTDELEFGVEANFFQNRLRLDATYYDRLTNDQIVTLVIPASTGYTSLTTNIGSISNKGVELGVGITPIRSNDFEWTVDVNFTKNENLVEDLGDLDEVTIFGLGGSIGIRAVEGQTAAEFYGPDVLRNSEGQVVVDPGTGFARQADDFVSYGSAFADWIMGVSTGVSYKNLTLNATMDYRKGGLLYSSMADINYFVGNAAETAYNGRNTWIVPNSVVENADGTYSPNTTPVTYDNVWSYWNDFSGNDAEISRKNVIDKTYFKLRQVTLSYKLPKSIFNGVFDQSTISVYGRNLLLWTPTEQYFIDPETTSFGTGQAGEFGEFYNTPSTRDFGLRLNLVF